jgi:hypothetical protein
MTFYLDAKLGLIATLLARRVNRPSSDSAVSRRM